MSYSLEFKVSALKEWKKLDGGIREQSSANALAIPGIARPSQLAACPLIPPFPHALHGFRHPSREDGKNPGRKPGPILWLWKSHHGQSACFRHLVQIGQQLDLIMVLFQDVCFQRIIIL